MQLSYERSQDISVETLPGCCYGGKSMRTRLPPFPMLSGIPGRRLGSGRLRLGLRARAEIVFRRLVSDRAVEMRPTQDEGVR